MRNLFFFCLLALNQFSCKRGADNITVLIENNSDIKPVIEIVTMVNDSLFAKQLIRRNNERVSYTEFTITKPIKGDVLKLKFFIVGEKDTTSCNIIKDSIKKKATVHVNFNEVLFKKGDRYKGFVLDKDTIIKKEFYSEVMY